MASAGSPEKSAGRAALSSTLVDIGVGTWGAGGTVAGINVAGGAALCLGVLGCRDGGVCGAGVEGWSSSLLGSLLSPKVRLSARWWDESYNVLIAGMLQ
jgi:hypothetical protein